MATIVDIARSLDISTATVSRALNQSRLVNPTLVAKINTTADELGYIRRNIRRHRGRAILNIKLILPRHAAPERALFYDFASLVEGLQAGFKNCGINLVCTTHSPNFNPYPHKKGGDTDGFVFAFVRPTAETLKKIREHNTPFIVLNRAIPDISCVASQNAEGMGEIVKHLLSRGKNLRPAFLSLSGINQIHDERLAGLAAACDRGHIAFDPETDVHTFTDISAIDPARISAIIENYNALICVNDIVGTVVLTELDRLGVKVPADIAVTGFDDSPVRQLSRPLLTTVSLPIHDLAQTAARRLEEQIIENTPSKAEILRVPGKFIRGQSS